MLRLIYLVYKVFLFIVRPITLGVRVMLIQEGKVLLIRQTYMSGWFMPGGGLKHGETLEQAARREAHEEVGAELGKLSLVGAYSSFAEWKSDHNVVFFSDEFKLSGKSDREVAEIRWFSLDALPEGLLPGHRRRLEEYQTGAKSPQFGEW
jgi:8-oxo-dGTP pyrophosphatase MutT (NUDIX family)